MTGRTQNEAQRRLLDPIHAAVACITEPILIARGNYRDGSRSITLRNGDAVRLQASFPAFIELSLRIHIGENEFGRERWRADVAGYIVNFLTEFPGGNVHDLIAFHWHPDPEQKMRNPHVHLGYAAGTLRQGLDKAHIPTGRLQVRDIIRFAITELASNR